MEKVEMEAFAVIGREGSTLDGSGFVQRLWQEADAHFGEISELAARNEDGTLKGMWGAMSDLSRCFKPWEDNFSKGLYLAGVECPISAEAPTGWTKWIVPAYECLVVECVNGDTFSETIKYMRENGYELGGAANDFTCPSTKKNYIYFPIKRL
ncbi:MAG: GyrI-like domain-containing protein [Eubacteriales bacterium]|nr:GyrI-like domain-containing protein [Eubacteriales bacterium]MDD3883245.1 GyrI-like domain-containing protein [Eubacteriales bacterium]MDD4512980.1 GyrI-like domain-containing protein [Eubacteriales bacterium]